MVWSSNDLALTWSLIRLSYLLCSMTHAVRQKEICLTQVFLWNNYWIIICSFYALWYKMINEDQTGLPQHFLMVLVEEHNFFLSSYGALLILEINIWKKGCPYSKKNVWNNCFHEFFYLFSIFLGQLKYSQIIKIHKVISQTGCS